jgi:hypothetical protein
MKTRFARVLGFAAAVCVLLASPVGAQDITSPQFTLTLPNYYMTPIGQVGGLEGGAFVARTNDSSANWYNPAGLALAQKSSVSSSAGSYQLLSLVPKDLQSDDSGGSSQQVPALVGVVVKKIFGNEHLTAGFAGVRTNSWEQQTDALIDDSLGNPGRLLAYSADSQFRRTEVSVGLGYEDGGPWRFGATLAGANTTLRAVGTVADQHLEPFELDALVASQRMSGSITQLRATAGAQYQATPEVLLGAMVRSPGLTLFRSGDSSANAVETFGADQTTLTFFDPDIRFTYKLPFQAVVGGALQMDRFEIEANVLLSTGTSAYDLFSTTRTAVVITDDGQGPPVVDPNVPYGDVIAQNRTIVNFAVGGNYTLTENEVWVLHFGFATDFSPVGEEDQFFTDVDLYGFTAGISGQVAGFTAALGLNYTFGSGDDTPLAELLESDISINSLAVIYSVAYKF